MRRDARPKSRAKSRPKSRHVIFPDFSGAARNNRGPGSVEQAKPPGAAATFSGRYQMKRAILLVGCIGLMGLAACGDTKLQRAGTGALIGGGAAALTHNDPLTGAAIGGVVGALR